MIRVACAIIYRDNAVLVTQRGPAMKHPGKWEFPGGKIEPGESDEASVIRELKEELAIDFMITGKLKEYEFDYGNFKIELVPFTGKIISGTITLSEHMNYAWLLPEQLLSLDWLPADIAIVQEVIKL